MKRDSHEVRWNVQVYTGNCKGKTHSDSGALTLRGAGAGLRVYIAQFIKGRRYSELKAVERLSDFITLKQYGLGFFLHRKPTKEDIEAGREGLKEVREIMGSGMYDLVVLDEANIAAHYDLFPVEELLEVIRTRPAHVELVITGRKADPRIIEAADLVTEMREIKHYYNNGLKARIGIEK